jgi:hypothetical protein
MRRGLLIALLLAATLPLACGGDEVSPETAVAEAATKTADTGSSRIAFEASLSGGGLPQAFEFTGEGEVDYRSRQARLTYDMSDFVSGGGQFDLIMDGAVMYMRFPRELGAKLPEGKAWVKVDLGKVGRELGIDIDELMQLNQGDPAQVLSYLRGASEGVDEVGEEEVRGVETTHYRARVDLRKSVELSTETLDPVTRAALRESVDRLIEMTGTETIPIDVWIDEEGLARRMAMAFDMRVPEATGKTHMEMSFELFDFGTAVDVEPPPAGDVIDLQQLIATGAGSGAGSS